MSWQGLVAVGLSIGVGAMTLGACSSDEGGGNTTPTASGGAAGGGGAGGSDTGVVRLTIFHTSDEHGWLLPDDVTDPAVVWGGAANLMGWLTSREGYVPGEQLLVSSGDNWSGAAVSTWFEGEPMVEAFDAMGYAATAIGNHEFDFGRSALDTRIAEAGYPYLSANIRDEATGELPAFATPYLLVPVQGVEVGIIGLTTTHTATAAHPRLVEGLEFRGYAAALEQYVPEARAAGAEVAVVLAHVCAADLEQVLPWLNVQVDVAFAGHCHDYGNADVAEVPLVSSGYFLHGYSRVDLDFDRSLGAVIHHEVSTHYVRYDANEPNPVTPDPDVAAIADHWQQQADALLDQEVGYSQAGIAQASWPMANWVVDSWLWAFPNADMAIQNFGSLRQSIPPGAFTVGDVVGMLPFENNLMEIDLTGAQLLTELTRAVTSCAPYGGCYPSVGGMRFEVQGTDVLVTLDGGGSLEPTATYRVLVTDYLYYGGDGYGFASHDPSPADTGAHMRQPVLDWTTQLDTSAADPLENHIDPAPRDQ